MKRRKNVTLVLVFTILIGLVGCAVETETVSQELSQPEVVEETVTETDEENVSVVEESEDGLRYVPGYGGYIKHPAFYEYEISEESMAYLDELIDLLEQGLYEEALETLDGATMYQLGDELHTISYKYQNFGEEGLLYRDKKISIRCFEESREGDYNFDIIILPLEDGKGYFLRMQTYGGMEWKSYLLGDCIGGQFNGEFSRHEWHSVTGDNYIEGHQYIYSTGALQDGVLHGELINNVETNPNWNLYLWEEGCYEGSYEDATVIKYTDTTTYENGFQVQSEIMKDDSNAEQPLYAIYGNRVYENGQEVELKLDAAEGCEDYITGYSEHLYAIDKTAFDPGGYYGYEIGWTSLYNHSSWELWY